jgi:hypothetical protein
VDRSAEEFAMIAVTAIRVTAAAVATYAWIQDDPGR